MKNICFVFNNLSTMGGAEKVTIDVINSIVGKYNIHVASTTGGAPFFSLDKSIKYTCFNISYKRYRQGILPAMKKLVPYYKKNHIDIAFIVENPNGFICSFTSLLTKTKQIYCDHGAMISEWNDKDIRTMRFFASRLNNYTMVLTEESKKDYIRLFHVNPKKLVVMPNWIDMSKTHSGYNKESTTIISAGRFSKEKCFNNLLPQIAKLVKQKHPDWQWHIYGDGELMEETSKKIKELNLENFLILKGKVNDLEQRYKDYGMCVMTSSREGMPLVLLEAKANGLPIVAFDVKTGPKEIVNDEKDGLLIPDMDVNKMADAICRLIENPDLREQMSEHALSTVGAFSKETILKQWIDFIESI